MYLILWMLQRELVLCSHEILASNREAVALSAVSYSSLCPTDVSSESATTSLKGYTDDYKSGSEAIQRSDDITVDSTVAGKRRIKLPVSMDNDQKTDDSSTSQQLFPSKPSDRVSFSGKQIPIRPSSAASWSFSSEGEKRAKFRKVNKFSALVFIFIRYKYINLKSDFSFKLTLLKLHSILKHLKRNW